MILRLAIATARLLGLVTLVAGASGLGLAPSALAQGMGKGNPYAGMSAERPASGGEYRSVSVSMPLISMAREAVGHVDFNLSGKGAIGLEVMAKGRQDEIDPKIHQATGESLIAQGRGAALFISRWSHPANMSGGFWGMGLGYRQETVKWRVAPLQGDKRAALTLADQDHLLNHSAELHGVTGHARAGYRYVGSDMPFIIGGYIGIRHFQAGVQDAKAEANRAPGAVATAPLSDKEKDKLLFRAETKPESGIEIGFVF